MELPAHGDERFAVGRIVHEHAAMLDDRVEHFRRFGQINVEKLGVEPGCVRCKQTLRFRGDFGRRRYACVGDHLDRGRQRIGAAALEFLQRGIGLRNQAGVADQLGIVAQPGELSVQLVARPRVRRRIVDFGDELRELRTKLGNGVLDRICLRGSGRQRLAHAARNQRRNQTIAIGTLLLDRFDKKSETGQRLGEKLELVVRNQRVGRRVTLDLLLAHSDQTLGIGEPEHVQRAAYLLAVLRKRRELATLRVVAEKSIQHLLHVAQIGANLAAHLRQQHALLRALRHLVQHRRARRCGPAGARGIEPREHRVHLRGEFRR